MDVLVNGQRLACCLSDGTAHCLKMPLTGSGSILRGKPSFFIMMYILNICSCINKKGHNGGVTSASWSHDGQWLLTGSTDRAARLWSVRQPENPLMAVSEVQHNFKTPSTDKVMVI